MKEILRHAWDGEWLVTHTTAEQRRRLNYRLFVFWLTIGTLIWLWLRSELWFVGFMSLYAIWFTHFSGWSAETPVETEIDAEIKVEEESG